MPISLMLNIKETLFYYSFEMGFPIKKEENKIEYLERNLRYLSSIFSHYFIINMRLWGKLLWMGFLVIS